MNTKAAKLTDVTTKDADGVGTFEAYASTYDVDSVGDKVRPGAFAKTLADWEAKGAPIPLLWSHRMDDPEYNLGTVKAEERTRGLWVAGEFDLENRKAAATYRLMKGRRVGQLSFAYDTLDQAPLSYQGKTVNELIALKLHEVSITPIGANQNTQVLGVKHAAEVLLGVDERALEAADLRQLLKAVAHVQAVLEKQLGGAAPVVPEPTTKSAGRAQIMRMQAALLDVGAL